MDKTDRKDFSIEQYNEMKVEITREEIMRRLDILHMDTKWLAENQTRPVNYLVVIIVSIIASGITAWVLTHW